MFQSFNKDAFYPTKRCLPLWFESLLTGTFFVCGTYRINRKVRKGGFFVNSLRSLRKIFAPFTVKGTLHRKIS